MIKELRWYQAECVEALWENLDRHVAASVPTGGGKSLIIAELCRRALTQYPGTRICVLAPRRELIEQNTAELLALWPEAPASIFCAGLRQKNAKDITVASIQSVYNKGVDTTGQYDLVIADEAHLVPHGSDGMFHKFFASHPEAKVVGLTATPYRLDGGMIHEGDGRLFDSLVYECDVARLIKEGFLSNVVSKGGSAKADMSNVHTVAGEFKADEMEAAFNDDVTLAAVNDAVKRLEGRSRVLVFVAGVEHGRKTAKALENAFNGQILEVYGSTPSKDRGDAVEAFRNGSKRFLVNCGVFTTGFNVPSVDGIMLLRATKSPGLYVQMVGRGLRRAEGKTDCLVLDYGGNVERHGPIDNVAVESKDRQVKKKAWECPQCQTYNPYTTPTCGQCGWTRPRQERDVEKGLSHRASSSSVIGDEVRRGDIIAVRYEPHMTRRGDHAVKAIYTVRDGVRIDDIPHYACVGMEGYPGQKARQWLARHGVAWQGQHPRTLCGMLDGSEKPRMITYKRDGKYWRILNYEF